MRRPAPVATPNSTRRCFVINRDAGPVVVPALAGTRFADQLFSGSRGADGPVRGLTLRYCPHPGKGASDVF